MSRPSTTQLAILGALAIEPSSGYEIRQSIQGSIGHFWSESFGQIYPTLKELENDGYIELYGTGARNSKTYAVTSDGRQHLQDLLFEEFTQAAPRDETLLRLFFGNFLGVSGSLDLLRRSRAASEQLLAELETVRRTLESEDQYKEHLVYWLLTVRSGELSVKARIDWANEAIAILESAAQ